MSSDDLEQEKEKDKTSPMSDDDIRQKIRYLLTEYPVISQSMLQYGLGPTLKAEWWRPVLDVMIEEGEVVSWTEGRTAPNGRHQALRKLGLKAVVGSRLSEG